MPDWQTNFIMAKRIYTRITLLVLLIVTALSSWLVSLAGLIQNKPDWKYVATLEDDRDSWRLLVHRGTQRLRSISVINRDVKHIL